MRSFLSSLALLLILGTPGFAEAPTTEELEAHLRFLASPVTEGRGLGSKGIDIAALYIESQFLESGLQPPFQGSYRQPFELVGTTPDKGSVLRLPGNESLTYGDDFVVFSNHRDLPHEIAGELVYGGYLIEAPERNWDDLKGVDLRGKILLVEVNEPGNTEGGIFEGEQMTYYGRWTYKYEQAARLGAKGILLIHNDRRATYGWNVVKNSWTTEGFTIPEEYLGSSFEGWITEEVARNAVSAAGFDYSDLLQQAETPGFRPVELKSRARVSLNPQFRVVEAANVGGLIPASVSEPSKAPTVVLTAHYDHIGMSPEGEVYAGVVDNSSATAALLTLARHFAESDALPINLLFLAVSAEEQGLWGSRYYASNPSVPVDSIWANINLEMTNIWGPTEDVYAIGAGFSDLNRLARRAAERVGLEYIAEQDKENGFFFRSDQFSFARQGIPGLWPHEGLRSLSAEDAVARRRREYRSEHYHQTSDSLEVQSPVWNLEGTLQMVDWVAALVEILAQTEERPEFLESSGFGR